jgi:hypothetical protein
MDCYRALPNSSSKLVSPTIIILHTSSCLCLNEWKVQYRINRRFDNFFYLKEIPKKTFCRGISYK